MKRFELILVSMFVIGMFMKLNLITGGAILVFIASIVLMFYYYFFGIGVLNELPFKAIFRRDTYEGTSTKRIFGSIVAGITLGAICAGILFKIQYYPGDQMNLFTGLSAGLIIGIIAAIKYYQTKDSIYKNILKRLAFWGGLGLILFFIPRMTLLKYEYRNHPKYIQAYEAFQTNPNDEELQRNLEKEYIRATVPQEVFDRYYEEE